MTVDTNALAREMELMARASHSSAVMFRQRQFETYGTDEEAANRTLACEFDAMAHAYRRVAQKFCGVTWDIPSSVVAAHDQRMDMVREEAADAA